ncbi:hypothetical protein BB559_002531 [Furculomyces boomerangus]|uniref:UBC core domain-containing protein n=1 Tax=Furculomyces boomerangus TaxID=61424 RepID=A0A2T9YUM1_9FUNG|nr:hypothetical protein BB559_002531 [Furculomyces boomerangus]
MASLLISRLREEQKQMRKNLPPEIQCYPAGDEIDKYEGYIKGPPDTPYQGGTFIIDIEIPQEYPFVPPVMRFKTPIYHPNIDENGRICMNLLKLTGEGNWSPSENIQSILMAIMALMCDPNPDDPLVVSIADEFITNHSLFSQKAKNHTEKYATDIKIDSNSQNQDQSKNSTQDKNSVYNQDKRMEKSDDIITPKNKKKKLNLSSKKAAPIENIAKNSKSTAKDTTPTKEKTKDNLVDGKTKDTDILNTLNPASIKKPKTLGLRRPVQISSSQKTKKDNNMQSRVTGKPNNKNFKKETKSLKSDSDLEGPTIISVSNPLSENNLDISLSSSQKSTTTNESNLNQTQNNINSVLNSQKDTNFDPIELNDELIEHHNTDSCSNSEIESPTDSKVKDCNSISKNDKILIKKPLDNPNDEVSLPDDSSASNDPKISGQLEISEVNHSVNKDLKEKESDVNSKNCEDKVIEIAEPLDLILDKTGNSNEVEISENEESDDKNRFKNDEKSDELSHKSVNFGDDLDEETLMNKKHPVHDSNKTKEQNIRNGKKKSMKIMDSDDDVVLCEGNKINNKSESISEVNTLMKSMGKQRSDLVDPTEEIKSSGFGNLDPIENPTKSDHFKFGILGLPPIRKSKKRILMKRKHQCA